MEGWEWREIRGVEIEGTSWGRRGIALPEPTNMVESQLL